MKKKTKVLLSSLLAISMSASLATGATYALFTSTSQVNVAVTSGKGNVVATIDETSLKTYSMDTATEVNGTFDNGGVATFEGENATLELINVTPEDSVSFNINVTNESNVTVQYRLVWAVSGELAPALVATADYTPEDTTDAVETLENSVTSWQTWTVSEAKTKTIAVTVDFPDADDNDEYQGESAEIVFSVEAVQGNANVVDTNVDNTLAETVTLYSGNHSATVGKGVKLADGEKGLTFSVKEDNATPNVTIGTDATTKALEVEIPEVSDNNETPILVTLVGVLNSNITEAINMLHDGVVMTQVSGVVEVDAHNEFYYDAATGDITFATKSFSNFTFVVGGIEKIEVATEAQLKAAVEAEIDTIVMMNDITVAATKGGYNVAGVVIKDNTLDGNGHTLTVTGANSTWDCGVYTTGGTIKNLTVAKSFRGIFTAGSTSDIIIDNCTFDGVVYTFNSDDGNSEYSVTIKNSTMNGWTSYSNVHSYVTFENCTFTEGRGYAFCRPYNATTFENCVFEEGYELDASQTQDLTFTNCKVGETLIEGENIIDLLGEGTAYLYYTVVKTADDLKAALNAGKNVFMANDITVAATKGGYNVAGVIVKDQTLNGNGHKLTVTGANTTWDCGIYTTGGTIKNLTVAGSFRGIFTAGSSSEIVIDNCTFDGVVYTFNSDDGNGKYPVTIKNSTMNGWTSFSNVHSIVRFENCTFAEGSGYAYCRPYNAVEFVNCVFEEGFELDTTKTNDITFENCVYGAEKVVITAENFEDCLGDSATNVKFN